MSRAFALLMLLALACSDPPAPPPKEKRRLAQVGCSTLLPPANVAKVLGHAIAYDEVRHDNGPFESLACENRTKQAKEVFAFDVGCGVGARERFRGKVLAVRRAFRQSEPKVGEEAWASENVYLSWFAARNCYSTVLMSWRRPHADKLRGLAEALEVALPR